MSAFVFIQSPVISYLLSSFSFSYEAASPGDGRLPQDPPPEYTQTMNAPAHARVSFLLLWDICHNRLPPAHARVSFP